MSVKKAGPQVLFKQTYQIQIVRIQKLQRKANKVCAKKKRIENNGCLIEIEKDLRRLELRKAQEEINNLKTGFKLHTNLCKDKNGNHCRTRTYKRQMERIF